MHCGYDWQAMHCGYDWQAMHCGYDWRAMHCGYDSDAVTDSHDLGSQAYIPYTMYHCVLKKMELDYI